MIGELFGEADEDCFGAADVAEGVDVLVLGDLADEFGTASGEAGEEMGCVGCRWVLIHCGCFHWS